MGVIVDDPEVRSPVVGSSRPRLFKVLGPGLITGASDDDPSGVATYSQAGAQFGFSLTWTLLFTYPLMTAIQIIAGRIGRTTGSGIAGVLRKHYSGWLLQSIVLLLLIANTINLGADLGAMADATTLIMPGPPRWLLIILFAAICTVTQIFLQYTRYVAVLKWLAVVLFSYFAVVFSVHIDWGRFARGFFVPSLRWDKDYITTLVAVFGTTISPYLFFWQASEEVEDIHAFPQRRRLTSAPDQGQGALRRIDADTVVGMGLSNLVALAIMVTAAATLNAHGVTDVQTSSQAAEALRPIVGRFAFYIFALSIVGTGLLAVPVLAGSGAYALGEARRWPVGFSRRWQEAKAFYATIGISTLVGMVMNFTSLDPIRALYWSAVVNGIISVPVMVTMMLIASRFDIMGDFVIGRALKALGWIATAAMGAAVIAFAVTSFM